MGERDESRGKRRYGTRVYERPLVAVWVYMPCRRDKIFQMAPGEILRDINWDNGASDLRRLAKKSVSCPQHPSAPTALRGDVPLLENVTESAAMHIQRNRILMKGADCSWWCEMYTTKIQLAINWEVRNETKSTQYCSILDLSRDDCSVISNSFLARAILLLRNRTSISFLIQFFL